MLLDYLYLMYLYIILLIQSFTSSSPDSISNFGLGTRRNLRIERFWKENWNLQQQSSPSLSTASNYKKQIIWAYGQIRNKITVYT
ncbi:hypothetical protein GGR51DRAFT_526002 [Nemania sp. FL0031]|nr:hypothetical protein GGR51DRAFT_526002 [Nemania sp. FL0031]